MKFIQDNFIDFNENLLFPFLTALLFIFVYPLLTTGSLFIWLKYKKWQTDIKNQIEKQQLLTLEQSISIRLDMKEQQKRFDELLKEKDDKIDQQQKIINDSQTLIKELKEEKESNAKSELIESVKRNYTENKSALSDDDFKKIKDYPGLSRNFESLLDTITRGYMLGENFPSKLLAFLEANDIIEKDDKNNYKFTKKGKQFVDRYLSNT